MKKIVVKSTQNTDVPLYIGEPKSENHPIQHQMEWLQKERGVSIPPDVIESLQKIKDLAEANGISFEELCSYALESALASKNVAALSGEKKEIGKPL